MLLLSDGCLYKFSPQRNRFALALRVLIRWNYDPGVGNDHAQPALALAGLFVLLLCFDKNGASAGCRLQNMHSTARICLSNLQLERWIPAHAR
jgi:hypothetical protein